MIAWAHGRAFDITLIEVMPLGEIATQRIHQYLPLSQLHAKLSHRFTLQPSEHVSGGPARYFDVRETGGRLGFMTPLTHNFCESCNRVRVTCTGTPGPGRRGRSARAAAAVSGRRSRHRRDPRRHPAQAERS